MTVKINASVLGIEEPIEIKETIKNMKRVLNVQILMDQYDKVDTDKDSNTVYENFLDNQLKSQKLIEDFTLDMLNLKGKKIRDAYEELSLDEASNLMAQIVSKVMHTDEIDEDSNDATKSDTKTNAPVRSESGKTVDPK